MGIDQKKLDLEKEDEPHRPFITVTEMIVVALVALLLWGLSIPAVQGGPAHPRTHCANNLKQISMAFTSYESNRRRFPSSFYYEEDRPDEQRNWVVAILRELDESLLADEIDEEGLQPFSNVALSTLVCRDDDFKPDTAHLSYAVNMGLRDSFYRSGRPYQTINLDGTIIDCQQVLGAGGFLCEKTYDGERNHLVTGTDIRDGQANTILCAENVDATFWNPYAPELKRKKMLHPNRLYEFDMGLVWFDWRSPGYNVKKFSIDAMKKTDKDYFLPTPNSNGVFSFKPIDFNFQNETEGAFTSAYFYARPSSHHANGFNLARFDGSTEFISTKELDYDYYCRLMSGNSSGLYKGKGEFKGWNSRGYGKLPEN